MSRVKGDGMPGDAKKIFVVRDIFRRSVNESGV